MVNEGNQPGPHRPIRGSAPEVTMANQTFQRATRRWRGPLGTEANPLSLQDETEHYGEMVHQLLDDGEEIRENLEPMGSSLKTVSLKDILRLTKYFGSCLQIDTGGL